MLAIDNCFDGNEMIYKTDIINLLISKDVDVNAKDEDGETALFRGFIIKAHLVETNFKSFIILAILTSNEIIDILVEAGANVNETNNKGDSPLIRCNHSFRSITQN